jgi:NAD(P)-dependent dehydrogenase (short-subunit alcohol dehydrogenase family)
MPSLTGKTALVTGANSGIGFETAFELAGHGALVVLACRDAVRGRAAADRLEGYSGGTLAVLTCDLASQASVRRAAARFHEDHDRLDILVNNAGVMAVPHQTTEDGFERQFATNHLGHFALTGLLLDLLLTTGGSRVVTVSSQLHRVGHLDVANLNAEQGYRRWRAYGQSKLANLLFAYELDRRLRAAGAPTVSVAAHPGWARTNLVGNGPVQGRSAFRVRAGQLSGRMFGQSAYTAAFPVLYAATSPDVEGGAYYGPSGWAQLAGPPSRVRSNPASHRADDAAQLWDLSEKLTGVVFDLVPGVAPGPPG